MLCPKRASVLRWCCCSCFLSLSSFQLVTLWQCEISQTLSINVMWLAARPHQSRNLFSSFCISVPEQDREKCLFFTLYYDFTLFTHPSIHDDYHPLHCAPGAHSFSRFSRLLGFSLCIDISPSPPPSNCRQIFKWNQINPISVKEMENFHENISKI